MALWRMRRTRHLLLTVALCVVSVAVYNFYTGEWESQHYEGGRVKHHSLIEKQSLSSGREVLSFHLVARWVRSLWSTIVNQENERKMFPWKSHKVKEVDCVKLFAGDKEEVNRSRQVEKHLPPLPTPEKIGNLTRNCNAFQQEFGFINSSLTEEERNFPIAYGIVVFKDAYQVTQLLRAIYRPHNVYCIHVDKKVEPSYREAMAGISHCFPNVFVASRSVDVTWGAFNVLEPELICMQELWRFKKWKYFINLTGQEFPLRTNWELVRILTAYNGANDVEGTIKRANSHRWQKGGPAPHGIVPTKGAVHIVVNRDFVDFVLNDPIAHDFLNWSRRTEHACETFFSSLNHNPHLGIRGSYKGTPETDPVKKPFLTRFKNWGGYPFDYPCPDGKWVRWICILSTGDLPLLDKRPEMFANKFYQDYSRIALDCLHERLYNHTRDEFLGAMGFATSYYENVSYVKNMVTAEEAEQKKKLRN